MTPRPEADPPSPTLDALLAHALGAPSGHDLQPTRFLVVGDPAARARVIASAYGHSALKNAAEIVVALADLHPEGPAFGARLDAAVATGLLTRDEAARRMGLARRAAGRWGDRSLWAARGAMLAVGALFARAEGLGVAMALVEDFDHEALRAALGIPDDHAIAALLAIGLSVPPAEPLPPPRLEAAAFADHFGRPYADPSAR